MTRWSDYICTSGANILNCYVDSIYPKIPIVDLYVISTFLLCEYTRTHVILHACDFIYWLIVVE